MTPQCSLSWFVKKPVHLSVSNSELANSGVAVIDVMFPTVSSFPFSQLSFKNNYTAFITIKVKCKDTQNPITSSKGQTTNVANTSATGTSGSSVKTQQKWKTVLRNYPLMPNPNSEQGSQKTVTITRNMMSHFNKDVVQFRLIIKQPSPLWSNFDIENLHFEQETKSGSDRSSALTQSLVTTLRQIGDQNKETSKKQSEKEDDEYAGIRSSNQNQTAKKNNFEQSAQKIGSILQSMWSLCEIYSNVKHTDGIGRFEIDGSYEINLLSYN